MCGGVDRCRLVEEVDVLNSGRTHDLRCSLERQADDANLDATHGLRRVCRKDRLSGGLVNDVCGEELEVGARVRVPGLAPVRRMAAAVLETQQLVDALVKLVVADGGNVESKLVQRLDRRLVVKGRRDQ